MAVVEVIKMGNPALRRMSRHVFLPELKKKKFQKLINNLIDTMHAENGAGIAAPQIAVRKRVFVMEMGDNPRYPTKESFPLLIAVNPEIEPVGKKKVKSWEGCLSIPGLRGRLKRYKRIRLKALDRHGNPYEKMLSGFAAVVAQHELDHLDGKLFIDRMKSMKRLTFQKEYEDFWL